MKIIQLEEKKTNKKHHTKTPESKYLLVNAVKQV